MSTAVSLYLCTLCIIWHVLRLCAQSFIRLHSHISFTLEENAYAQGATGPRRVRRMQALQNDIHQALRRVAYLDRQLHADADESSVTEVRWYALHAYLCMCGCVSSSSR